MFVVFSKSACMVQRIVSMIPFHFHTPPWPVETYSPPSSPENTCRRTFSDRVDLLINKTNIWKADNYLLERADFLLDLNNGEDTGDGNAVRGREQYCREKCDFLLDLADKNDDSDGEVGEDAKVWKRKAGFLLGLSEESESEQELLGSRIVSRCVTL